MIGGSAAPGQAWLVPFADLALILFVITATGLASALSEHGSGAQGAEALAQGIGEGVATSVFVDSADAPALAAWLARHRLNQGEQLTLLCQYNQATMRSTIVARCETLAEQAIALGQQPRLIVEQGTQRQVIAYFAHDRDPLLERYLQPDEQT